MNPPIEASDSNSCACLGFAKGDVRRKSAGATFSASRRWTQVLEHPSRFAPRARPGLLREIEMAFHDFCEVCAVSEPLQIISLILQARGSEAQHLFRYRGVGSLWGTTVERLQPLRCSEGKCRRP